MKEIECTWMSLKLKSPFVLASLTMMSNVNIVEHINYYVKAMEFGAGAIVLPSINPTFLGSSEQNQSVIDSLIFDTGLNKNHKMGFAVLGPTMPNIISVNYGLELAKRLVIQANAVPVIGSITNIGEEKQIISAAEKLSKAGVDAIELNFSCPNVKVKNDNQCVLSNDILKKIRNVVDIPISLKITPYEDYSEIINNLSGEINGLTLSNAYIGLVPPNIKEPYSPFRKNKMWSPSGVYGPFERLLTFYQLYKYRSIADEKNLDIACVGGLVSPEECVQAILLGANIVQLSSAVLWNGLEIFNDFYSFIKKHFNDNNISGISEIKGKALKYVTSSANELGAGKLLKMKIDQEQCKKCNSCLCCNRLCVAISQSEDKTVTINKELCSGCGWCYNRCIHNAIIKCES